MISCTLDIVQDLSETLFSEGVECLEATGPDADGLTK